MKTMPISDAVSNKLANMSFVCACLVVCIHISAAGTTWFYRYVWLWLPVLIMRMAVPFFFMASGFLLAGHVEEDRWWGRELHKRVHSLLIPYFSLNLLWFFVKWPIHWYGVQKFGADPTTMTWDWTVPLRIVGLPPGGPMLGPLWYVRNLFLLVTVSPVLVWVVKRSRGLAWLLIIMLTIGWIIAKSTIGDNYWFSFSGISCFCTGMTLRYYGLPEIRKPWAAVALCFAVSIGVVIGPWGDNGFAVAKYLLLIAAIWAFMPSREWPRCLTGNAFAIYVFHGMFIYFFSIFLKFFKCTEMIGTGPGYCLQFGFCVFGSCLSAWILKTRFPLAFKIFLGARE